MKNDLIEFNIAVAECKVIIAKNSKNFLRLGEIGATVETIHGDSTLKKLAKEAGLTYSSLRDYVSVWKAFDLTTVVGRPTFSALAALVNHPDRQALIAGKPTMTSDEARKIARGYKASISPTKTADDKIAAAWGRVDHSLDSMLKAADGSEHVAEISDFIKTVSRFKTVLGPKIVKAVKPEPVPYIDERTVKAHVQLAMLYEKEDPEYYAHAQREILAPDMLFQLILKIQSLGGTGTEHTPHEEDAQGTVMCSYRLLTSNRARADRLDVRFTPQLVIWGGAAEDFEEIRDIPERTMQ